MCWAVTPPAAVDSHQLLHRLLPTKGWPVHVQPNPAGSSCEPYDPAESAWLPLPNQRAQVAKMLLEQVSFKRESAEIVNHHQSLCSESSSLCPHVTGTIGSGYCSQRYSSTVAFTYFCTVTTWLARIKQWTLAVRGRRIFQ